MKEAENMGICIGDRLVATAHRYTNWYQGINDWMRQTGGLPSGCGVEDENVVQVAKEHGFLIVPAQGTSSQPQAASLATARRH
ncbi:hypothetical protein V8E51_005255 [Hyaloscypha variabilis]